MKPLTGILVFSLTAVWLRAQTTPEQAVQAALQNHPLARAAAFDVQAKKYSEKAALQLPNPELNAESPTGEFYAVGVLQSFEFPTVYIRQKQVARAETALALAGQQLSENELRYTVRALYLETQAAEYRARLLAERDSLYQAISATATRQFAAGEIDFIQKTLAENEAGKLRQQRLAADQTAWALRQQLATLSGLTDLGSVSPLAPDTLALPAQASAAAGNPALAYGEQAARLAEQQLGLAKSRALPNFSLGYLNQGARNTPIDYRFRVSVGIPLWAGQYRAGVKSAEAGSQAARARAEAQSRAVVLELARTRADLATALNLLRYYEREALPRSRALIAAATRMREAGEMDYIVFLRTLDEAYVIQREYADQVLALNSAQLHLRFLAGN